MEGKTYTEAEVLEALKRHFRHDAFRMGQREAVMEVLSGRDVVVVMPTGSGKSLCYQLPAMLLPGTTVVVSPLIALMKDQVDALEALGIPAAFINSSLTAKQMNDRLAALAAGRYKQVYVAPERFRSELFVDAVRKANVSLLVVDEAHCISQWGHDFRPDYLTLRRVAKLFPGARIMAVTATATPSVRRDIIAQIGLGEAPRQAPAIHVHGFARGNLFISVTRCRTHAEKLDRVLGCVRRHGTGIIYCATTKQAERTYELLAAHLPAARDLILYHGKMGDKERTAAHNRFIGSASPVVVATNAFGMGVDRADIRFVAHWDIPGSVEAYYQEIGRAGRDGKPSHCELLFNYADVHTQEFFIDNIGGENPGLDPAEARFVRDMKREKLDTMLKFVDARTCRHKFILDYFGEDTARIACPGCDNCHGTPSSQPLTETQWVILQKILSCVARMKGRFGPKRIVQVLVGDSDPVLEEKGLTALSTYGILEGFSTAQLYRLLDALVRAQCIEVSDDNYHLMAITPKGVSVAKRQLRGFSLAWPSSGRGKWRW